MEINVIVHCVYHHISICKLGSHVSHMFFKSERLLLCKIHKIKQRICPCKNQYANKAMQCTKIHACGFRDLEKTQTYSKNYFCHI